MNTYKNTYEPLKIKLNESTILQVKEVTREARCDALQLFIGTERKSGRV